MPALGGMRRQEHWLLALLFGCVLALLASIYPLPIWLQPARPDALVLLVIYWTLHRPREFGVVWAWSLGLLLDGFEGGVLGKHALALAIVAYLALEIRNRLAFYALPQQVGWVMVLAGIDVFINQWVSSLLGRYAPGGWFLLSCLTTGLCWPLLIGVGRHLRRIDD